jgi:hypothetical protein
LSTIMRVYERYVSHGSSFLMVIVYRLSIHSSVKPGAHVCVPRDSCAAFTDIPYQPVLQHVGTTRRTLKLGRGRAGVLRWRKASRSYAS